MRLLRVQWLQGKALRLHFRSSAGVVMASKRGPRGTVSIAEAARALGTYELKLYRMKAAGQLKTRRIKGSLAVPVFELYRVRAALRNGG